MYDVTLHLRVCDDSIQFWEVSWDALWTLSFGLSQFRGHGSWLVCEVAQGPVSIALQELSLVERAKLVQVCFTLCLREQRSI